MRMMSPRAQPSFRPASPCVEVIDSVAAAVVFDAAHPAALEERVGLPHDRDCFDVARAVVAADASHERGRQTERAKLRVDDHAADRPHMTVCEGELVIAAAAQAERAAA